MNAQDVIGLAEQTLMLTMILSAPILMVGLVVGLMVALFQATTQIQEMTLTFVPKIFAVVLALMFFSSWMLIKITDFTSNLIISIPDLIH